MRRIVALLSIALLIAAAIGWPRSRSRDEGFALIIWKFAIGAGWSNGSASLALGTMDFDSDRPVNVFGWSTSDARTRGDLRQSLQDHAVHSFARFGFMAGAGDRYGVITMPWWSIAAIAVLSPCLWARKQLRERRRAARGLCLTCGYDLRASTDRCPECGATSNAPGA